MSPNAPRKRCGWILNPLFYNRPEFDFGDPVLDHIDNDLCSNFDRVSVDAFGRGANNFAAKVIGDFAQLGFGNRLGNVADGALELLQLFVGR